VDDAAHELLDPREHDSALTSVRSVNVLTVDDAALAYELRGDGAPVVFVHGTGTHRLVFGPTLELLSDDHALVTYDRRGFGASEGPVAGRLRQHTGDLAALVRHLDRGPATVVAISGGAVVALDLAATEPHLVRQLVLAEPAVHFAKTPSASAMWAIVRMQARRILRRDDEGAVVSFYRWASSRTDGSNGYDPLPEEWRRIAILHARAVFRELTQMFVPYPRTGAIRSIRCPTTLVIGDVGVPVFHRTTRLVSRLLPHSVSVPVAGTGHLIPTDQPRSFAGVVADALAAE
jgi:pimeloyl-ACP methyl ester carboxylesterase